MSLDVFWQTIRQAYERAKAGEEGDSSDGCDMWLSPAVVSDFDFDIDDFDFLPKEDQSRLEKLVEDFAKVAEAPGERIGPTKPAERNKAKPLLTRIAEILDFDRYQDPDALRLGKLIERELERHRLNGLVELEFKTGFDHTDDPGIWIRAYLDEASSKTDDEFLENAERIRLILDPVARQVIRQDARRLARKGYREEALDRWPYISFRSIGERAETAGAS